MADGGNFVVWDDSRGIRYDPERTPRLIYQLALLGLSEFRIAEVLFVSVQTIENWKDAYPAVRQALFDGGGIADARTAHSLYKMANGYEFVDKLSAITKDGELKEYEVTKKVLPDFRAAAHWLGVRQGHKWRQAMRAEVALREASAEEDRGITHDAVTASRAYQQLMDES